MPFVWLAIVVLIFVSLWKLFVKAGLDGWRGIVPIYNTYLLVTKVAGLPVLWFILMFIPIANIIASVYTWIAVAKRFGQGVGFAVGLILLTPIFLIILAFGSAKFDASVDTSLESVSGGAIKTPDALKQAEQATQQAVASNSEESSEPAPESSEESADTEEDKGEA